MTLLVVFGLITLALVLLYLVSFVALVLRERLIFDAVSFGPGVVFAVMHTLPFLLILLVVTTLLLLHVLVRHFAFAYMKPVALTLGFGLLVTLAVFALVLIGDKNSRIAKLGEGRHLPGVDMLHARFRDRMPPLVLQGTIIGLQRGAYIIRDDAGREIVVTITKNTRTDQDEYKFGDRVMLLGERFEQSLRALGIRMHNETKESFPRASSTPFRRQ